MALGDAVQPQGIQQHRVVLDAYGFIKGWIIATSTWMALLLIVLAAYFGPSTASGADYLPGILGMAAFYGVGAALVVAAPLGWLLACLLRPVRSQWIHIAAFFVVPTLAFWALGSVLGVGWQPVMLLPFSTVGAAAALGRWAVRNDVVDA